MQQLLKALPGAAGAESVPAELLSQLLVAVDDPESAPNLRLGRVSLSSAYLSDRRERRFSNSPWRATTNLLSTAWPLARGGECRRKRRFRPPGRLSANGLWRPIWAFGRKGRQEAVGPTASTPPLTSAVRPESQRRDYRDRRVSAPGQLRRPVARGPLAT
jgi:hypothetical protein